MFRPMGRILLFSIHLTAHADRKPPRAPHNGPELCRVQSGMSGRDPLTEGPRGVAREPARRVAPFIPLSLVRSQSERARFRRRGACYPEMPWTGAVTSSVRSQEPSITLIFRGPRHLPSLSTAELPRGRPRLHRCCGLWKAGTNFPHHLRPRRRPGAGGTVDSAHIIGLACLHVLHARMGLEPQKSLQAEYWISGIRGPMPTLGCLRLGQPTAYVKGADLLPSAITAGWRMP